MVTLEKTKFLSKLTSLSIKKRASLAHALIQSLDTKIDDNVEQSWDIEIQERIKRFKEGKTTSFSAFEALDKIKQKYQK